MITGYRSELVKYKGLNVGLDQAIDFLTSNNLEELPVGLTTVNDLVTITKLVYVGKDEVNCIPEQHKEHLDMQILLKNKEYCNYDYLEEIDETKIHTPYNDVKDVVKYSVPLRNKIIMDTNNFVLFTPDDIHQPSIKMNDEEIIKLVVKVKI